MIASPFKACGELDDEESLQGKVVVLERGDCMFVDKVSAPVLDVTVFIFLKFFNGWKRAENNTYMAYWTDS